MSTVRACHICFKQCIHLKETNKLVKSVREMKLENETTLGLTFVDKKELVDAVMTEKHLATAIP